jgi:hypothetical protein
MREDEIISWLRKGEFAFAPADLRLLSSPSNADNKLGDGILVVKWGDRNSAFLAQVKTVATPKAIAEAVKQVKAASESVDLNPMLIFPYLSEERLLRIEEQGISALDLNGNGTIRTPELSIWRSGYPNQFKESAKPRNPYRGDSSVFARCLLLRDQFESLTELREFALSKTPLSRREGEGDGLALATASRAVDALEEFLVVVREHRKIRLIDKSTLLDGLRKEYRQPDGNRILGRTSLAPQEIWSRLEAEGSTGSFASVATGISSAAAYCALSGVSVLSLYVTDLVRAKDLIPIDEGKAFANIELVEERRPLVYFDARKTTDGVWSSPIQCWIELANSGPREQEASQMLLSMLRSGNEVSPQ